MVEEFGIPTQLLYVIVASLLAPTVMGVITFLKRQDIMGQKNTLSEYNISGIRVDLTEVKGDVKELRKDQQSFSNSVNAIKQLQERADKVEIRIERHEDALRQIDNIKWRLSVLEDGGNKE